MIGRTISHYRIIEKLGGGGMGVVYKAEDTRLDRAVALKFLPPHLSSDPDANARFVREAKAASALDHPNICTIYDIGETDDGQLFIAMAYYKGETLKKKIAPGSMSIPEAVDLATQMARGLAQAHEAGIVHRDIKPPNVMVTDGGAVKILDFGLAKLAGTIDLTKTGSTVGTAAYMSPEQARGEEVDPRTDLWALGVVLYEMLTGERPFRGDYDPAIIYSLLNEDPEPISALRSDVPEALAQIVHHALEKERNARHASMTELLDDLKAFQAGLQPSELGVPHLKTLVRQPRFAIPGLILLVVLGAFAVWWYNHSANMQWARQVALPKIDQLVEEGKWSEAYGLATQAEKVIPTDSMLLRLWPRFSKHVTIRSEPPNANVSWRADAAVDADWIYLGQAPLDNVRIPIGPNRFKVEKEGFRTIHAVSWLGSRSTRIPVFRLDGEANIPNDMVQVSGGENLNDFLMDTYEVTNEAYKRFVDAGGYEKQEYWKQPFVKEGRTLSWEEARALFVDKTGRPGPATWEIGYPEGQGDYPVSGVSWYEAAAYAEFVGKSLPTIHHWNRAAGLGLGFVIIPLSNLNGQRPAPVGSHQGMGPFGTYDMAGNVREWCWNEVGHDDQHATLGGGWNDPAYIFTLSHYAQPAFDRSPTNGFRCVKYLDTEENLATLSRKIDRPYRDFFSEEIVSDETFDVFLRMYDYDKTPLNAEIEYVDESEEDWVKERITFDAAYGNERVIAYLFLPKRGTPPYQTVVYFPGGGAVGAGSSEVPGTLHMSQFDYLLRDGRAVMYPIYKSTYERSGAISVPVDPTTWYLTNLNKEHNLMWAKDLARSLDYLETRAEIDTHKLAYFGYSMGGRVAPIMLAVEKRFKVSVLCIAGLKNQPHLPEADPLHYVPRVTIPVLMLNGEYDHLYPVEIAQRPFYELLGTPEEDKKWIIFEGGHFVPNVLLAKETLAWLDRYLGPVQ